MAFRIRPYHPSDMTALYRVCLLADDGGTGAAGHFKDSDLLGHYWVAPYLVLEPELASVLVHSGEPVGYTLGTLDSSKFYEKCERGWFPPLRERYPIPVDDDQTKDAEMIRLIHRGHPVSGDLSAYPAHLHIDILPMGQRQGWGRKLIDTLLYQLRDLEVTGVHLGVGKRNTNAIGFYKHIGFHTVQEHIWGFILGMRLK